MVFQYINICQVPREMLKTSVYGLGFQHLPRDLANVNAWKSMFDPYNETLESYSLLKKIGPCYKLKTIVQTILQREARDIHMYTSKSDNAPLGMYYEDYLVKFNIFHIL